MLSRLFFLQAGGSGLFFPVYGLSRVIGYNLNTRQDDEKSPTKRSFCRACLLDKAYWLYLWWALRDSNPRPSACKADALNQLS